MGPRVQHEAGCRWWRGRSAAVGALILATCSLPCLLCGADATAQPGAVVRFTCEGRLRAPSGYLLEGPQRLSFAIFRGGSGGQADSGTLLYGETAEVDVKRGRLVHAVGTGTPTFGSLTPELLATAGLTANPDEVLWLQVSAGEGQAPVLPRTQLQGVPYAAAAGNSEKLGGEPAVSYAKTADLKRAIQEAVGAVAQPLKATGSGYLSFIGGGRTHDASGGMSGIVSGTDNHATWWAAFVGGGSFNWATGAYSAVTGGLANAAVHNHAFVGGGAQNRASGEAATVAGGTHNTAAGANAVVPGGQANTAGAAFTLAAGRRAKANALGSFVWADSQDLDAANDTADSALFRTRNGTTIVASSERDGLAVSNQGEGRGISSAVLENTSGDFFSLYGNGVEGVALAEGVGGDFASIYGDGIRASSNSGATGVGARVTSNGSQGTALMASATAGDRTRAIWAIGSGWAGYFQGTVQVLGTLIKSSGSFKIDHPLDPANKYLSHSFVESPDMMNVYNGNAVLDDRGEAVVELPAYFEALNRDYRYQLTPIGGQATLYVAQEVKENRFRIAGGLPGLKVSWQVTGIRQDAYARAHPIAVEEPKPEDERGTYLHPVEHGEPGSKSVSAPAQP